VGEEMNGLRTIAIILIILLCALFIYVAEDIPAFGDRNAPPIKAVKLFTMEVDQVVSFLDQHIVPEKLSKELVRRGLAPPSRVEKIPGIEGEWNAFISKEEPHYAKEEKYYWIKKERNRVRISRYAFVVRWIEKGLEETAVPNMVTYGLADYRGYDTLGETTVIFTAGVSVILLLRRRSRL
jgi:multicomponent Na+:H+ antiporter subunit B